MSEIFESQDAVIEWATGPGLRILRIVIGTLLAIAGSRRLIGAAVHPRLLSSDVVIGPEELARLERLERRREARPVPQVEPRPDAS